MSKKLLLPASNYTNLCIILADSITKLTGLKKEAIINGFSIRGPDLIKTIEDYISTSYNLDEVFIVFNLKESPNKEYFVLKESDNSDSIICYYDLNLNIYGNNCSNYAQKLLVRYKDQSVLWTLYDRGIFVQDVSYPEDTTEFINNTVWRRLDMTITIKARINISEFDDAVIDELGEYHIITEMKE